MHLVVETGEMGRDFLRCYRVSNVVNGMASVRHMFAWNANERASFAVH